MEHVVWHDTPTLRQPIVVAAFEGWNDAGDAASTAARWLANRAQAQLVAEIDPEWFTDFNVLRPLVRIDDGVRHIEWPITEVLAGSLPGGPDLIIVVGHEPRLRWRTFCDEILGLARSLGAETIISLGALLADVAHRQPVRVIGSAVDPELIARYGLRPSRYEGPTGITGVLQHRARAAGFAAMSLWAPVPSYVSAAPSPKAALALVDRFAALVDVPLERSDLQIAAAAYERQVDELVDNDEELADYVARISEIDETDETDAPDEAVTPLADEADGWSGDDLAAELEEFLRDQGRD